MLIVRASSWWNRPVNLFHYATLFCSARFSSYKLSFFKSFFILHFTQRHIKSQVQSGFWNWIQQLSGFPMPWGVHVISSRTEEGQAGKRAWRAAERYPLNSQHPNKPARCALAKAREWLQMSLRARNWAITFLLRLLSSQDLEGKQSWKKKKMASLCHKISTGTIQEDTSALGFCTALCSLSVSWWWHTLEIFGLKGFPAYSAGRDSNQH